MVEGSSLALITAAEGRAPLHYQWLRYGVPLQQHSRSQLYIASTTLDDAASYSCKVSYSMLFLNFHQIVVLLAAQ